jgi:hypothetical protein
MMWQSERLHEGGAATLLALHEAGAATRLALFNEQPFRLRRTMTSLSGGVARRLAPPPATDGQAFGLKKARTQMRRDWSATRT